jgi:outer membrane lipoprotein-sorting protein
VSVRKLRSSPGAAVVGLLALVLSVVAGCATLPPAPRQKIESDATELMQRLETRWREFASLRTLADLVVQQSGERHQVRGVLLAKAPTSARFEALSPMGQPLLLATVHDGRITTYDATTNEAYVGDATAEVTARFLHLPIEPDDLVGILAGRPTGPLDVRAANVLPADDVGPSIEMVGAVNRRRIWFDPATAIVRQVELAGGRAEARVRYERAASGEVSGFTLTTNPPLLSATVRYQDPRFDAPLASDAFALTIPKGAKIQQIR